MSVQDSLVVRPDIRLTDAKVIKAIRVWIMNPARWATTTAEVLEAVGLERTRATEMGIAWELRAAGYTIRRRLVVEGALAWVYFHPDRAPAGKLP